MYYLSVGVVTGYFGQNLTETAPIVFKLNNMSWTNPTPREKLLIDTILNKKGSKEGFWQIVEILMKWFSETPILREELEAIKIEVKKDKDSVFNKFAASKDMSYRKLGHMPARLYQALKKIYGDDPFPMSNDEFNVAFFQRYKDFKVADVI